MLKEKSIFQTRTFSIIMVAIVAALAMVSIFFLTRTLTTATPVLRVEAPSVLKAAQPQVVGSVVTSSESQRRTQLAKAYIAVFGSTSRAQEAETARWNGLAGQQISLGGNTSQVQQAETARWNGLAGLPMAAMSGSASQVQQAEIARWNGLAGLPMAAMSGSTSRVQQAETARWNGLAAMYLR